MEFIRRTTAPTSTNKYYIHTSAGGYNNCIKISGNSCIPNCVGYCYGRFLEANGLTRANLPTCNAESWLYRNSTFEEGSTPRIGAVMVWAKGKVAVPEDGAGHVAFIEHINYDSNGNVISVETSESAYGGTRWYTKTRKPPYTISGYTFLGFMYSPNKFDERRSYTGVYPTLPLRGYFKNKDTGTQVKYLQQLLNWLCNDNLVVDGIIGSKTLASVSKAQRILNVSVDSLFGRKTLAAAKNYVK